MISCGDNLHVFIHSKVMEKVNLASFTTGDFDKGASFIKQTLWFFMSALFVRASWNPFMGIKIFLLRAFGARIGKGLVIKNNVTVKFPGKVLPEEIRGFPKHDKSAGGDAPYRQS